jgi:hypothetical protein
MALIYGNNCRWLTGEDSDFILKMMYLRTDSLQEVVMEKFHVDEETAQSLIDWAIKKAATS